MPHLSDACSRKKWLWDPPSWLHVASKGVPQTATSLNRAIMKVKNVFGIISRETTGSHGFDLEYQAWQSKCRICRMCAHAKNDCGTPLLDFMLLVKVFPRLPHLNIGQSCRWKTYLGLYRKSLQAAADLTWNTKPDKVNAAFVGCVLTRKMIVGSPFLTSSC